MSVDTPMEEPASPRGEEQSNGAHASYVPHDIPYSVEFEDSLMNVVLNGDGESHRQGISVLPEGSDEVPISGVSIRSDDVSLQTLPSISESQLPLPLDHPLRKFASPVPGVRLTHPGGYLEGGPGLEPEMDTFSEDFLSNNQHVQNAEQLRTAIDKAVAENLEMLRERMEARQRAKEHNEQIEKDLEILMEQHSMELKVHSKLAEERRAKKEAKEKRRMDREAG